MKDKILFYSYYVQYVLGYGAKVFKVLNSVFSRFPTWHPPSIHDIRSNQQWKDSEDSPEIEVEEPGTVDSGPG